MNENRSKLDDNIAGWEFINTDLENCGRCLKPHENITFKKFTNGGPDHDLWTHWALCPDLLEPIMMRIG
jgi:hypothetical protein